MSMQPIGNGRHRQNLLRQLAHQAAAHPRIEAAVIGAIRAELPGVIEGLLREAYGGDTVRIYVPSRGGHDAKLERDRRIAALAAAPSSLSVAAIAAKEGLTVRRVQQILRNLEPAARKNPP